MDDTGESIVTLEQAKSGRSTCRATGERIGAGEWRVGFETFIGGRIAMAWMLPLPFLRQCCRVEYCLKPGNQGSCKATRRKFERGDVRFVCTAGDPAKKIYLSLCAAGAQLQPVFEHVGGQQFSPTQVAGVAELAEEDRQAFYQAFEVPAAVVAQFDQQHPPPPAPTFDTPAKKGKRAADGAAEGASTPAADKPAKRARGAKRNAKAEESGDVAEAEDAGGMAAAVESGSAAAAEPVDAAGSSGRAAAPGEEQGEDEGQGLTEYERQRLEQIRRNRERMMALNLPGLASELAPPPAAKPASAARVKGVSSKRLSEQVLPRRESARVRGIAADGSQVQSERAGKVVVVAGEVIRQYAGGTVTEEAPPQERHPQGAMPFRSANASAATDEAFIQLLAHAAAQPGAGSPAGGKKGGKGAGSGKGGPLGLAAAKRLQLAEEDVAKVTKDATTHLAFHPAADTLLLACADKKGSLGLWHVDHGSYELPAAARRRQPILQGREEGPAAAGSEAAVSLDKAASGDEEAGGDEEAEFDGVLSLQPQHYQYICGLKWAGGTGRGAALFTASYDGSLRRLDVEAGLSALVLSSEEDEYSCMDATGDGRTVLLGDNEGALRLVDVRAGAQQGKALTLHSKKINTVHFEPAEEQVFATSSTDTSIQLWDIRKLGAGGKPLAAAGHSKGCQSALFAPDGSRRLVSTSFDNTLRVWDGRAGLAQLSCMRHDNNTGRWVLPFRACWTAAGDGVVVGNMKRFVDVFDAASGELAVQLSSEHMTAIASRNAAHPVLPVLASATNSGRIHVYR